METITLKYGSLVTVSRARASNVATLVTEAHGLSTGMKIDVSGFVADTDYNLNNVTATVTSSTTFTYPSTGSDEGTTADINGRVTIRKDFSALSVKGFDPVDHVENYPDILHRILDGSFVPQNIGDRRHFEIVLDVRTMQTYANRLYVANFWKNAVKKITYTHDSITETNLLVVKEEGERLEAEWIGGYREGRLVVLKLQEQFLITSFPA